MTLYDQSVNRTASGSSLVPTPLANEIIQEIPAQSVVMQLARQVRMSTTTEKLPVLSALPNSYWVNGDTGLKATTTQAWANKVLTAEELAVIIPIPDSLMADSQIPIWDEVKPRIAEAIGAAIDAAALFGTNKPTSWPVGLVPGAVAAGNSVVQGAVAGHDISVDVSDVFTKVEDEGYEVDGVAARSGIKGAFRGLRATTGEMIYAPSMIADSPSTLYGEDIVFSRNGAWDASQAHLIAGDWDNAIIGLRQDLTLEVFTEGVITDAGGLVVLNLMQQDVSAVRAVVRVGFQVANPATRMNGGTGYPFAVLHP